MSDRPYSAFTPFSRRFTDERARDLKETFELYERMRALHRASIYADEGETIRAGTHVYAKYCDDFTEDVLNPLSYALKRATLLEKAIFAFPDKDPDFPTLTLQEGVDLRRFLRAKEYFLAHETRVMELFKKGLEGIFEVLTYGLPTTQAPSPFSIPIINTLLEPRLLVDRIYNIVGSDESQQHGIFSELLNTMYENLCRASGVVPQTEHKKPLVHAMDVQGPLDEMVHIYLQSTPFEDYLLSPIPLKFSYEDRFSHMHVLGGSGAGKTTLLKNLILHDMQAPERPSLVIIDSQGDLIRAVSHLQTDRKVILISPKDIEHPPALNIFDVKRLGEYTQAQKEQVVAGVIDTFDYLFEGLLGADLSAKQGVFFRFVARLMLALPETLGRNATILDMIALMDDPEPYRTAIESLPPIQRTFFERDFLPKSAKTFVQTREQVRYRLNAILENPTLARLFTSNETKIDLFTELNQGSIILVDTAKDFLKSSSSHFGRIFISLVLQAILERAAIDERKRYPTLLYVDEAAEYFDSNIDDLLTAVRKYACGCVFSHQFLDQATSQLRASLAANTTMKLAGGVSIGDARTMASEMRTTPDFIISQPRLHFAAHFRNITPNAISIPVRVGLLEGQPQRTPAEYQAFIEANRELVSIARAEMQLDPARKSMDPSKARPPLKMDTQVKSVPSPKDDGTDLASEW